VNSSILGSQMTILLQPLQASGPRVRIRGAHKHGNSATYMILLVPDFLGNGCVEGLISCMLFCGSGLLEPPFPTPSFASTAAKFPSSRLSLFRFCMKLDAGPVGRSENAAQVIAYLKEFGKTLTILHNNYMSLVSLR
jgi:hypothetical protein